MQPKTVLTPRLGLAANRQQFWLLVLINAFVGSMVGLERTVLPLIAEQDFGIASKAALLSFIATFGVVKAGSNLLAGHLGDRIGRKQVLVIGWVFALPVPLLIYFAPTWGWIVAANVALGINQGLAWSAAVVMKIDLAGPRQRGLAMGLNEFAGYLAVALTALATGVLGARIGLRAEILYFGVVFALVGLILSLVFARDTRQHARLESGTSAELPPRRLFAFVSLRSPALSSACQAGLVNNLNDGLAWGLFPLFFLAGGLSLSQIGVLSFIYPAVWSTLQLYSGALSDRIGRKWLIASGMLVQAAALAIIPLVTGFWIWVSAAALLGVGTAMVYPTLLASVADVAAPAWRSSAVGIYRLWRDSGYVVGALIAGVTADAFGIPAAILTVAVLTLVSGVIVMVRMPETAHGVMPFSERQASGRRLVKRAIQ